MKRTKTESLAKIKKFESRIVGLEDKLANDEINSADFRKMKDRYENQITELKLELTEIEK